MISDGERAKSGVVLCVKSPDDQLGEVNKRTVSSIPSVWSKQFARVEMFFVHLSQANESLSFFSG